MSSILFTCRPTIFKSKAVGFFLSVFLLVISATSGYAQGNLLIMPKRLIFDGPKRSDELNLANIGKDTATYVVSLIHIRMKSDGTFEQINQPDSGQLFADKFLRFFPRTVTLAPNESQVVKVQLIKTNELQTGEYRSHIYFRAVPKEKPLGETEPGKDSGLSVKIVPIFGISIPAIIRVGESDATVSISQANLELANDSIANVKFTFTRQGNMSVYGDVAVEHISKEGKRTPVGIVKGLAVYTPNAERRCLVQLDKSAKVNYHSGKLHLIYSEQAMGKPVNLAETEIVLH